MLKLDKINGVLSIKVMCLTAIVNTLEIYCKQKFLGSNPSKGTFILVIKMLQNGSEIICNLDEN